MKLLLRFITDNWRVCYLLAFSVFFEQFNFLLSRLPGVIGLTETQRERSFRLVLSCDHFQFTVVDVVTALEAANYAVCQINGKEMFSLLWMSLDKPVSI